jgi:hypothetical protein
MSPVSTNYQVESPSRSLGTKIHRERICMGMKVRNNQGLPCSRESITAWRTMNAWAEHENAVNVLHFEKRIKALPVPDLFHCAHNSAFSPRA